MAAKVTDPHDLLVYKLSVLLTTEREIERALPTLEKEAHDDELKQGFRRHLEETREHVGNVEQALSVLGVQAQGAPAPAVKGLVEQYKAFASAATDDVQPDVLDAVSADAAAATEHHEIAAYESAITLARGLRLSGVADALEQNLEQEQTMLEGVKSVSERLSKQEEREARQIDAEEIDPVTTMMPPPGIPPLP
jgi:ferritin-like metal-binding protein YciE